MKLTVVGAGGIRMPLFVRSLLRRVANGAPVDTLAMTDIRPERLATMERLTRHLVERAGARMTVAADPDLDRALAGADAVVLTIRPGFEDGRIVDEAICRRHGVLGQETVGAGGFSMAARSIPQLLHICGRARAIAPGAVILNFTNPSGICTQALHDAGFARTIGICDSADNVKEYIAVDWGISPDRIRSRVFGLNHLSGTTQVWVDGADVTARLMNDDAFIDKWFGIFGRSLVRELGAFPNEYLYYYLLPEQALAATAAETETRGQKVKRLTDRFFAGAADPAIGDDPEKLLALHAACLADRSASYMEYAWKDTADGQRPNHQLAEGEGYAGVALDVLEAKWRGPAEMALIYPNRGATAWMAEADVIETTCTVDDRGVTPLPPATIPARLREVVRQVRIFETLTVMAVRYQSAPLGRWALASHPLLDAAPVEKLFADFVAAHAALGAFR
jgi:6-phospho-beta-glucosidase